MTTTPSLANLFCMMSPEQQQTLFENTARALGRCSERDQAPPHPPLLES
jgi:hypothetical protein